MEIIKLIWPLIALQLILQVYAIVDIAKKKKTKNLTPTIWLIIIIFGEILGGALYLLVGRAEE